MVVVPMSQERRKRQGLNEDAPGTLVLTLNARKNATSGQPTDRKPSGTIGSYEATPNDQRHGKGDLRAPIL